MAASLSTYLYAAGYCAGNGLVVDDGIVVTETSSKLEEGMPIRVKAANGRQARSFAVISTLLHWQWCFTGDLPGRVCGTPVPRIWGGKLAAAVLISPLCR